jgi:hypothetical protein
MINHSNFNNDLPRLAATACLVGPCVMVLSDILTIVLNNKVDPIVQTISGFAVGSYGWLEKIGIMTIAISFLLIGLVLLNGSNTKNLCLLKTAGILFLVAAAGFLFTSLINTTLITAIAGIHFSFHKFSLVIGSIAFYQACLIFTGLMIPKPGLRAFGIYSGFVYLVGLTTFLWVIFSLHYIAYSGLAERILAAVNLIWIMAIGPHVIKFAGTTAAEKHQPRILKPQLEYNQTETGAQPPFSTIEVQGNELEKTNSQPLKLQQHDNSCQGIYDERY